MLHDKVTRVCVCTHTRDWRLIPKGTACVQTETVRVPVAAEFEVRVDGRIQDERFHWQSVFGYLSVTAKKLSSV